MKEWFVLILILFLLVACTQYQTINPENQKIETISEQVNATAQTQPVQQTEQTEQQQAVQQTTQQQTAPKPKPIILATSNVTISSIDAGKTYSLKGKEYTLEVVDVTKDEDGCLIRVNGITDLINLDSTKTVNGLEITVLEVYAMRSQTADNDICKLIVR